MKEQINECMPWCILPSIAARTSITIVLIAILLLPGCKPRFFPVVVHNSASEKIDSVRVEFLTDGSFDERFGSLAPGERARAMSKYAVPAQARVIWVGEGGAVYDKQITVLSAVGDTSSLGQLVFTVEKEGDVSVIWELD